MSIRPRPAPASASFNHPARPNTANRPSTATMTGKRKGAPIKVTSAPRPRNARRASARATGMASAKLNSAERAACNKVNRIAAQSPGPSDGGQSARAITAPSGTSTHSTTSATMAAPVQWITLSGRARLAMWPRPHHGSREPHLVPPAGPWQARSNSRTHRAVRQDQGRQDTSSWSWGSPLERRETA